MSTASKTVVFYVTDKGQAIARIIEHRYPGASSQLFSALNVRDQWRKGVNLVFIMAAGIVVRTIAPLLKDKLSDPAVVVLDENGNHVVSLLSGHAGGANCLAAEIANAVGAVPVITTGSDVALLPALDVWAEAHGLVTENQKQLPKAGTRLINKKQLLVYSDVFLELPEPFLSVTDIAAADVIVTNTTNISPQPDALLLRPKNLVAGIGCNSGTPADEIEAAVRETLATGNLSFLSLRCMATIDKKALEPGLVAFCEKHNLPLVTFSATDLNKVKGVTLSAAARKATGAKAVAEPSALLASGSGKLLVKKEKRGNVTVAVADQAGHPREKDSGRTGKIFIVGTGPGSADHLTPRALRAIRTSDVIVGYGTYLDLIRGLIADKQVVSTGMAREIERSRRAIELAGEGKTVAVVSGGDPGIYAMAGLVLELLRKESEQKRAEPFEACRVEVIPGISALSACAARLGAPLMHDFACISLSDRLTAWAAIEKRLAAAAEADFVIVLYNPRSKGRTSHISKARELILRHREPATPVGIVKRAMRAHETIILSDLAHMPFDEIDMQTTVIIGNSKTFIWNDLMITPRGYQNKETW
jgi:cobalt-precorrin 5A hydrolase/precorrin-3B C17-methyltransferase